MASFDTSSAGLRLDIRERLRNDTLVLMSYCGTSNRLVVCFSGIGATQTEIPPIEFVRGASHNGRDSVLFVIDPQRTWLNGDGLIEEIVLQIDRFKTEINASEVYTLGHSMGGFSALAIPAFFKVKCAIGFSPQFSVHPDIAGDDLRWMNYRGRIKNFRLKSVGECLGPETEYFVFHGRHGREKPQRDRFPIRPNLDHFILPKTVHNVPARLKQHNILGDVISQCFQGKKRRVRLLLAPLNAYRRTAKDNPVLGPQPMVTT